MKKVQRTDKQRKFQRGSKKGLSALDDQMKAYLNKRAKSSHMALSKLGRQELQWLKSAFGVGRSGAATKAPIMPPPSLALIGAGVRSRSVTTAFTVPAVPDLHALLTSTSRHCYFRLNRLPGTLPAPNWQRPPDGGELLRSYVAASDATVFLQAVTWKDDPDLTEEPRQFLPWDVISNANTVSKKLWHHLNLTGFIPGNDGTGSSDVEIIVPIEVGGYTFGIPPGLDFENIEGVGIAQLNVRLVAMYMTERFEQGTEEQEVNLACHVISPFGRSGSAASFGAVYHEPTPTVLRMPFRARSNAMASVWLNVELTIGVSRESNLILGAVFRDPLSRVERNFVHVPWLLLCETGEPYLGQNAHMKEAV